MLTPTQWAGICRKLAVSAILLSAFLALWTGVADLVDREDLLCSSSACLKIHSSTFATAFVIPLGFYAAAFLGIALGLYLKGKEQTALMLLYALLGMELYLTFIQVFFIGAICFSCLVFMGTLAFTCVVATLRYRVENASASNALSPALVGMFIFFIAHFAFFFPDVELKPTLMRTAGPPTRIEVFASPSCPHCKAALSELRPMAATSSVQLVVRPVALSRMDTQKTVDWICQELFQCRSRTARKLAEKIAWENQEELLKLTGGKGGVPLIVVAQNGEVKKVIKGWSQETIVALASVVHADGGWAFAHQSFQQGRQPEYSEEEGRLPASMLPSPPGGDMCGSVSVIEGRDCAQP